MNQPDQPGEHLHLPQRTTPTWEIELLISGAVVFALLQALAPLESAFAQWIPRASSSIEPLLLYSYIYAKLVLFILIISFALHLAARAFWVALVGVHSVYPQGPRWENLAGGPIARAASRIAHRPVDAAIESADNRASLVFAVGILAAQFSLVIYVWTMLVVLLGIAVNHVDADAGTYVMPVFGGVVLVLWGVVWAIDRYAGHRLDQRHWLYRAITAIYCRGMQMTLAGITQPLMPLITTNLGGKRGAWLLMGIVYLGLGVTFLDTRARISDRNLLSGPGMSDLRRDSGVHPLHYADQRKGQARYSTAPYIPSELVDAPYLRLFVPFDPDRHSAALIENCPPAAPPQVDSDPIRVAAAAVVAEQQRMACFSQLLAIRMDGKPLPGLTLERHRDNASGHDGGLAMIDIRNLAVGRHVLEIQRPAAAATLLRSQPGPATAPDRIVFWR